MRKILVTGGAGFIGSNLIRLLIKEKGCEVINVDKLTYAGNPESLADVEGLENYHFEQVDLASPENELSELFQKYQPDAVMHLAAESHVDRSIDGPSDFIQANVVGTYNLLQAALGYWRHLSEADFPGTPSSSSAPSESANSAAKDSFRFLHVSTDEVYGSLEADAPGFSETTPYDPHSPYSASKAASDHLARAWGDTYGLPILVTNCSNNYGPYQFPEKLIPVVILKCLRGESIPVYGKGENIRDWLYVQDHAEALHTVLTKGRVGETYNIGGNNERQNIELVKRICSIMDDAVRQNEDGQHDSVGPEGTTARGALLRAAKEQLGPVRSFQDLITFVTDRPGHDMRYAIDAAKIHDELGWEPKEDFESGFRKTVQWYLENPAWWERILSGDYNLERLGKN